MSKLEGKDYIKQLSTAVCVRAGCVGDGLTLAPNDAHPVTVEEPAAAELPLPPPTFVTTMSSPAQTVLLSVYASKEDFTKSCHENM